MKPSSFHIFNASAGSGKTFNLVKEYLKVLFSSNLKEPFKSILAITFTNKAVGEMKDRIIKSLKEFSSKSILQANNIMFDSLCSELQIEPIKLHHRSKEVLESIVHNYAAFDVSTIDKFNQKLIRTFAFDLKLPLNFEVELDTDDILEKAVDNLIAKAGTDKQLTKVLIDFAVEKIDEDKSWDVAYDFNQIAKLIISENENDKVRSFNSNSLNDFDDIKNQLSKKITTTKSIIIEKSEKVLQLIDECGLEHNDFSGKNGLVPSYFFNLSISNFSISYDKVWMEKIDTHPLYPKNSSSENLNSIIDEIQPQLILSFQETKDLVIKLKRLNSIYKNITPLSVLNIINKEIDKLKDEQNILLISEFNSIVSDHIKTQPAPFIYERIGEKFKHFFIDEFQDTSIMQWQNLIPLIENALSGENASALIVGDAKQAIYRWRGGKAEQFIALCNSENPFQVEKKIKHLAENYRSSKSIVKFNNDFFKHISQVVFSNVNYENLYKNSSQNGTIDTEGFVNLTFLNFDNEDDKDLLFSNQVLKIIDNCLKNGFSESDMCILVRYKKEGVAIADYLNANSDINIISSETLLLSRSPEVNFIIDLLNLVTNPGNKDYKFKVASYLTKHKFTLEDNHEYLYKIIDLELAQFFKTFEDHGFFCNYTQLLLLPIYESIEVIIHDFYLVENSNAYIQYLLDFVLDFTNKHHSSLVGFLDHYYDKKEKLSIVSPEGINAVTIMTIHKAKGLEFPIVIFPYANLEIYREKNPKVWLPVQEKEIEKINYALINYNKDVREFGEIGSDIYESHEAELELDNINLLYVTLTRAISQLYIISRKKLNSKGLENTRTYGGLFINYLKQIQLWNNDQLIYTFGSFDNVLKSFASTQESIVQKKFISTPNNEMNIKIVTNSGYLWDTDHQHAIEKGNLIHLIMSQIKTRVDIEFSFDLLHKSGKINTNQIGQLRPFINAIVSHPQLANYYTDEFRIYNERDIILKEGITIRPDRVVINKKKEAVIIDYKTGQFNEVHKKQIAQYKIVIQKLGFTVLKSILVYVNDSIELKEM